MSEVSGYRLHCKYFDRATGKHQYSKQDFKSRPEADLAKAQAAEAFPEGCFQIASIVPRPKVERREKIGPGHPEWQGEKRLTA